MIKISYLNKYFNKGQANQIHVLNNIDLTLPDTGFVTILGASGSGKSTFLNVIGGLDKYDQGSIEYSNITDLKKEVGFVFQNYLLLDNLTVAENLRQALEVIGINDPTIQDKRIKYVLKLVNLSNFERKRCINLSGGEKQRVSIARALLKRAKLILADEPTGNLDSENTIEIMNILKGLSNEALVVLVTHEENLAYCYSDRIIAFKDGLIVDDQSNIENADPHTLQVNSNNKIYLLDFDKKEYLNDDLKIELYSDNSLELKDLKLVIKNNTVYVQTPYKTVDAESNKIKFINSKSIDYTKNINKFNIDETVFADTGNNKKARHSHSFIRIFKEIVTGQRRGSRILRWIFAGLGAICAILVISYSKYSYVDDSLVYDGKDLMITDEYGISSESYFGYTYYYESYDCGRDIKAIVNGYMNNQIEDIEGTTTVEITASYKYNLLQSNTASINAFTKVLPNNLKIYNNLGRLPVAGNNEVVISKSLYNYLLNELEIKNNLDLEDLSLSFTTDYSKYNFDSNIYCSFSNYYKTIVGVIDDEYNYAYIPEFDFYNEFDNLNTNLFDYDISLSNEVINQNTEKFYQITSGSDLSFDANKNEIIVNKDLGYEVGDVLSYVISSTNIKDYTIVGLYEIKDLKTTYNYDYLCYDNNINACEIEDYNLFKIFTYYQEEYYYLYLNQNDYKIVEGNYPKNTNEIVLNVNSGYKVGDVIKKEDNRYAYGYSWTVVGLYETFNLENDNKVYPINNAIIVSKAFKFLNYCYGGLLPTFTSNSKTEEYFEGVSGIDKIVTLKNYTYNLQKLESESETSIGSVIFIIVLVIALVIYSYFTTRSKLINDIKSIGTRLAVGEPKGKIMKYYLSYSFILTLISSAVGYLIIMLGYIYITIKYNYLFDKTTLKTWQLFVGLISLFGINTITSILPCLNILKNTPAKILSKYDI